MKNEKSLTYAEYKNIVAPRRKIIKVQNGAWKGLLLYVDFHPHIEDTWFDLETDSRYAVSNYRVRRIHENLPMDECVVYTHTMNNKGVIFHITELIDSKGDVAVATEDEIKTAKLKEREYETIDCRLFMNPFKKKKLMKERYDFENKLLLGRY